MEGLEREIYRRYIDEMKSFLRKTLNEPPQEVSIYQLMKKYDAFCFDGFGTLYNRGDFVYPGALEMFQTLREKGKQIRIVSNAASDVDCMLAADAVRRGFVLNSSEFISSGSLLPEMVEELRLVYGPGGSRLRLNEVYYIGRESGKRLLETCGIVAVAADGYPREPVVAVSSAVETPKTYKRAVEILRESGSILLVMNPDAYAPGIDGTREPVSGALCERLRRDSACWLNHNEGCTTFYLGKPFPDIWYRLKSSLKPTYSGKTPRAIMIGDTLGTDILGARIAGMDCALLVGRNQPAEELLEDQEYLGVAPDYYLTFD